MLFPNGMIPAGPPVDSKKALLLIDFQNDFVTPTGKLPVDNVNDFLPNLVTLVSKFRSKGSVIWARTEFEQVQSPISERTGSYSILLRQFLREKDTGSDVELTQMSNCHDPEAFLSTQASSEPRTCLPGTGGAAYPRKLAAAIDPKQDLDIVKTDYSAFSDSSFLVELRTRLITHLYICGSLSNISVYATVLDAVMHGVEVTLVEDCLGYRDTECHFEAMRQMADTFGAAGVDYQELMDDLAGLLGDVIREEDFATQFQVSIPRQPVRSRRSHSPRTTHQRFQNGTSDSTNRRERRSEPPVEPGRRYSKILAPQEFIEPDPDESPPHLKSSEQDSSHGSPDPSPPRKRSPSALDETAFVPPKLSPLLSPHYPTSTPKSSAPTRYKINRPRVRRPRNSRESVSRPLTPASLRSIRTPSTPANMTDSDSDSGGRAITPPKPERVIKKKKPNKTPQTIRPTDVIGSGDSRLVTEMMPMTEASAIFAKLKTSIKWSKMHHRSGEVPRLVAVQGLVSPSDPHTIPIYRHPADESPTLLPFDATVNTLRQYAEKAVGHPLNHVLIQLYRSGEDNISEHADKTLDVVRGSSIVNLSLGAQRTMTLRTKRSSSSSCVKSATTTAAEPNTNPTTTTTTTTAAAPDSNRTTQRVPLPHASLFILGQVTNQFWLHSIRADKRPACEKSASELAFNGERISLTFRQIGTFVDTAEGRIWGQGARGKKREKAKKILVGREAEEEWEGMIAAFGRENQESDGWRWEGVYGEGFDVVDFVQAERGDEGVGGKEGGSE